MTQWHLECTATGTVAPGDRLATLSPAGAPWRVVLDRIPARAEIGSERSLWRYAAALPWVPGEPRVTLGEGGTPLLEAPLLAAALGVARLWIKDEAINPTASFKARGMSLAVSRAKALGVPGVCVPTAGNAGAALAAYAAAAGLPCRIVAPHGTPPPILGTIRALGAEVALVDGHIGDAGEAAKGFAAASGFLNVATVREPYRVEGMKTMGYELAEQLGWRLPTAIVYPTGGGEGTIGIWKAIGEMIAWGWLPRDVRPPRLIIAQAAGCAPLVRALGDGTGAPAPWPDPVTFASGLRVPAPLGGRWTLQVVRESGGAGEAIADETIREHMARLATATGVDAAPEGGAALAAVAAQVARGMLGAGDEVVLFNTGSGASYRW